jgi:7-cyano-7-deazaguanine synthase
MTRAVVLLSGGLDSTTTAAIARADGFEPCALTVSYGQVHVAELDAARRVVAALGIREHRVVEIDLAAFGGSALVGDGVIPKDRPLGDIGAPGDVPATYVPARNTVLLALALAWCEALGAHDIYLGVNVLDASGYPDCRPEFVDAFETLANLATRSGTSGERIRIRAPLITLSKADIIRRGLALGVDYAMTHSCYDPAVTGGACGRCDACVLRKKGFAEAGVPDPTVYAAAR